MLRFGFTCTSILVVLPDQNMIDRMQRHESLQHTPLLRHSLAYPCNTPGSTQWIFRHWKGRPQVIRIPASKIQDAKYRQDIHQDDEASTSQQVQCQYINRYSEVFWRMPQIITKVTSCILYPINTRNIFSVTCALLCVKFRSNPSGKCFELNKRVYG